LAAQVVAVTGGARGIGLAIARAYAAGGARVAIGDVDGDEAGVRAAALGGYAGRLDVRDRASFAAFLAGVAEAVGPVDVLVNNAGVAPAGNFVELPDELLDLTVDVNLRGVLNGMRAALPAMLERGSGRVVNIASLAGRIPLPGGAVYGATKHAVVGLTAAVRAELRGTGVHLTAVLPTFVRTEMVAGLALDGIPKVDADAVAAAVVRVGRRRRPPAVVTVPRWLTGAGAGFALLPPALRDALGSARGGERMVDADDRVGYERRVAGLLGPRPLDPTPDDATPDDGTPGGDGTPGVAAPVPPGKSVT
jgi:NAD(P)-dependent dehydrogenase (short-subunit alcohol dehydrogenase family)